MILFPMLIFLLLLFFYKSITYSLRVFYNKWILIIMSIKMSNRYLWESIELLWNNETWKMKKRVTNGSITEKECRLIFRINNNFNVRKVFFLILNQLIIVYIKWSTYSLILLYVRTVLSKYYPRITAIFNLRQSVDCRCCHAGLLLLSDIPLTISSVTKICTSLSRQRHCD